MAGITSASTRRNEIGAVYAAGLLQGLALVTFPAAATILTTPLTTDSPAPSTARCSCLKP